MAKKISIDEAVKLYQNKKNSNLKLSWTIFKKKLNSKDYPIFKIRVKSLNNKFYN